VGVGGERARGGSGGESKGVGVGGGGDQGEQGERGGGDRPRGCSGRGGRNSEVERDGVPRFFP
jgi:hypothetical protein